MVHIVSLKENHVRHCPAPRCLNELFPEMVRASCEKILSQTEIS